MQAAAASQKAVLRLTTRAEPDDRGDAHAPDVSIVIVCWNAVDYTIQCVESLRRYVGGVEAEVFVVDNASADGAGAALPTALPDATVILNDTNAGFAAANNQAFHHCTGRYILLLNADTLQTENAVGDSVQYMDEHPEVGILGVGHRNGDAEHSHQPSAAAFPDPLQSAWRMIAFWRRREPVRRESAGEERDVDWVTGSFFLIRRSCFEAVGPLDERFFVFGEDIDYCFQARRKGWSVRFWPQRSIVHFGSSTAGRIRDKTFMVYRNELEFFRKNFSFLKSFAFYCALNLRMLCSTLWTALRCLRGRSDAATLRDRLWRQWSLITLRADSRGVG